MSVAEQRKLQIVYDDIDQNRYKPALAELNRYLKKHPKSQLALCLKVVVLKGLEYPEEIILAAYAAAKRYRPYTEPAAHSLAYAFRAMRRSDLILEMYQEQLEDDPKNPEWGEKALMAAVEHWDTKAMMQSSRKLASVINIPKVARWAAFAQLAEFGTLPNAEIPYPASAPAKSLLMANHFLKLSNANAITEREPSVDIVWLNIHVLLADNQLDAAYAYIKEHVKGGALARKWLRLKVVPVIGERIAQGGEWSGWKEEWEWAKGLLIETEEPERNFAYHRYLVDNLFHILASQGNPSTHPLLTATRDLFLQLEKKHGQRERAPLLALLEFDFRANTNQKGDPEEWLDMIKRYWDVWGPSPVVCDELNGVIPQERFGDVMGLIAHTTDKVHNDLTSFKRTLTLETLLMARRKREEITMDIAERHWALYKSGLKYGDSLGKDDVQCADSAAFMAVHGILASLDTSNDTTTEARLLQTAACLEVVARNSPASPYARFLLVRIYRKLGAITLAIPHFNALKISEIQFSSLSFVLLERSGTICRLAGVQDVWKDFVERAQTTAAREAATLDSSRKTAMEHESYSKIGGMLDLKAHLSQSTTVCENSTETILHSAQTEPRQLIDTMKQGTLLKSLQTWDNIYDTRDWGLVPNLGPEDVRLRDLTQDIGSLTPQQSLTTARAWRRLQSLWSGEDAGVLTESIPDAASFLSAAIDMLHQITAKRLSDDEETTPASLDPVASDLARELEAAQPMERPVVCAKIIELRSLVNLVVIGTEASHAKGKPKKQVQATATLHAELREVKKVFDTQILASVRQIDETKTTTPQGSLLDEPTEGVRTEVDNARETCWIAFRKMMKKQ